MRSTAPFRLLAIVALAVVAWSAPSPTSAYCRLTTTFRERCPRVCPEDGVPLSWASEGVYTFHADFVPGMAEADVRRIFETSFDAWLGTECLEGPVDVRVRQDPATTLVDGASETDGVSVVVHRERAEWLRLHPASARAFALTLVAFTTTTGRIVGADMELNGGLGRFTECPDSGCVETDVVDLANVVTHEAGHFLGLADSRVAGSTMACTADVAEVSKRTLAQDDVDGICEAYPGRNEDAGGCQCQAHGRSAAPFGPRAFALCLWAWLWMRRGDAITRPFRGDAAGRRRSPGV